MLSKQKGFTLIELMIVVAVVGILAAIALPSYNAQIRKGKRTEAQTALMALLQSQERYRANCPQYASGLAAAESCAAGAYAIVFPSTSSTKLYAVAVTAADGISFTATATAGQGSSQSSDTGCTTLTLTQNKGTVSTTPTLCW